MWKFSDEVVEIEIIGVDDHWFAWVDNQLICKQEKTTQTFSPFWIGSILVAEALLFQEPKKYKDYDPETPWTRPKLGCNFQTCDANPSIVPLEFLVKGDSG